MLNLKALASDTEDRNYQEPERLPTSWNDLDWETLAQAAYALSAERTRENRLGRL
jgi:hypothetical protein